jgi:hypothetical protein
LGQIARGLAPRPREVTENRCRYDRVRKRSISLPLFVDEAAQHLAQGLEVLAAICDAKRIRISQGAFGNYKLSHASGGALKVAVQVEVDLLEPSTMLLTGGVAGVDLGGQLALLGLGNEAIDLRNRCSCTSARSLSIARTSC